MSEDFVTYELAVKLKDKGFREKCIAYYWEKINEHTPSFVVEDNMPEDGLDILDLLSNHNQAEWSPFIDAPTISQVLKWLREEKKMHIIVEIADSGWYYTIYPNIRWENGKLKSDTYIMSFKNKESYEQAALAGIEYTLNNLI